VAERLALAPLPVTVRVKVVSADRGPTGAGTPLVMGPTPPSTVPAPPVNEADREVPAPLVMMGEPGAKLAMAGPGGAC
jgi:hypothetical protein